MRFLYYLSDSMIPLVLILVTGYGLLQKVDIFDAFIEGAVDGFKTVYKILPTLIGLMIAIGILRESGTLGYVASVIAPVTERLHFPSELVPLVTVKMFSSRRRQAFSWMFTNSLGLTAASGCWLRCL